MLLRRVKDWWSNYQTSDVVGVDISTDNIKLVEINSTNHPFKVLNFAITPIPANAIEKNEIKNTDAIGTLLSDTFREENIKAKNVAIAISRASVFIKSLNIDKRLTPAEIESRAWIEANRHFPELVGEIYLDFNIKGEVPTDHSQLELTLVACRKDQIKPHLAILQEAGLFPKVVDVNCYALERALAELLKTNTSVKTAALLNLDLKQSSLIVSDRNELLYAHDQSYDGQRLINETKNLDPNDPAYSDVIRTNLVTHLRHAMNFFYSSRPQVTIQQLVISGDCAVVPNISRFIQEEIGIETALSNPFANMSFADNINKTEIQRLAPTLTLACGLALANKEIPG